MLRYGFGYRLHELVFMKLFDVWVSMLYTLVTIKKQLPKMRGAGSC